MTNRSADNPRRRLGWPAFLAIGLLLGLTVMAGIATANALRPHRFSGTVLQAQEPAPGFTLQTGAGRSVSLDDLRGKLVVLFFGYTFCPDVCPTTLHDLDRAMDLLGPRAAEVQVVFISVDTGRDSPDKVADYASRFNPDFLGVTGSPGDIDQVATVYGIYYDVHDGTQATGYLVDHTASVMVVDRGGYLRLIWPWGTTPEAIADDLAYLLR